MASGWLSALLSGSGVPNEYVCPHRYLLWLASTLMLITILGDLVPPSPEKTAALGATLGADVAMMLLGAAEHALPNPWRALFLAASGAAFVPVVRGQMTLLGLAAEAMEEEDAAPLTFMRTTMLATWSTYPVLRLAAHAGLVGVNTQECVNCVFDILTKMGYTTVLSAWRGGGGGRGGG